MVHINTLLQIPRVFSDIYIYICMFEKSVWSCFSKNRRQSKHAKRTCLLGCGLDIVVGNIEVFVWSGLQCGRQWSCCACWGGDSCCGRHSCACGCARQAVEKSCKHTEPVLKQATLLYTPLVSIMLFCFQHICTHIRVCVIPLIPHANDFIKLEATRNLHDTTHYRTWTQWQNMTCSI
jgi:hypothetical protein